ncbi:MAG: nuclear transport factor 2 family protein [Eudoraea sp.]|nr:nuclear transport factor 2 family protein [Eudoraea sp.]
MNKLPGIFFALTLLGQIQAQTSDKEIIHSIVDGWHIAAGEANFENYFGLMTEDAIFIGTDAAEVWNKTEFMAFSKPYFDKGKAWDFKAIQRNIYLDPSGTIAWFDELLDTWMQLCRGSGVLKKENGKWKIAHYVLSVTIPNEEIDPVIALKKERDSTYVKALIKQ